VPPKRSAAPGETPENPLVLVSPVKPVPKKRRVAPGDSHENPLVIVSPQRPAKRTYLRALHAESNLLSNLAGRIIFLGPPSTILDLPYPRIVKDSDLAAGRVPKGWKAPSI
jgi:hypothetical protein